MAMFGKFKKKKLALKPELFTVCWYPSSKSYLNIGSRKVKLRQMPPLMVRKPEWRQ